MILYYDLSNGNQVRGQKSAQNWPIISCDVALTEWRHVAGLWLHPVFAWNVLRQLTLTPPHFLISCWTILPMHTLKIDICFCYSCSMSSCIQLLHNVLYMFLNLATLCSRLLSFISFLHLYYKCQFFSVQTAHEEGGN